MADIPMSEPEKERIRRMQAAVTSGTLIGALLASPFVAAIGFFTWRLLQWAT